VLAVVVYILAPAGVYTGGPTALFQLCKALREEEISAMMAFYGNINSVNNPVHPNYQKYQVPWTILDKIEDGKDVAVIAPETATDKLARFTQAKKIIYWLAVDNYVLKSYKPSKIQFILHILKNYMFDSYLAYSLITNNIRIYYNAYLSNFVKSLMDKKAVLLPKADLHLAQSKYAYHFLKENGIENILTIHEPLEEEFLSKAKKIKHNEKIDAIAWNARKAYPSGLRLVRCLKKRGLPIFDLKNVGKNSMIEILSKTKIFLDIGFHPGRDRPAREAIVLDNITVVNNHGGYYYFEDLMIPPEFKLNLYLDSPVDYNELAKRMVYYLQNFEDCIKKFYSVKEYIMGEPILFSRDVQVLSEILKEWKV
jgi:hypothetical protein